ncbi:carboxypeptidase-like regulatory domain-containing protein [Deinococcus radiodurans]|uniref:carboxypeptidase-like regulatory domain-containing protein n=1 Tax=Deinococcus radiodurans TaxID=1299 RepID=UPI001D079E63|nr:carboxypeptidase-like regulatory domain-containing protein [Deinococcus radiodurans]
MKNLLLPSLALTLALASCSSAPTPPATAEQTDSITGTVVSGSGTGKVILKDDALGQLSEAPVAADGSFTLPCLLPRSSAAA